jgi:hypothetical protein
MISSPNMPPINIAFSSLVSFTIIDFFLIFLIFKWFLNDYVFKTSHGIAQFFIRNFVTVLRTYNTVH